MRHSTVMNGDFNSYREIFKLVRETGEKLVIINPDTSDALVVLPLSDYQALREKSVKAFHDSPAADKKGGKGETHNFSFWQNRDITLEGLDTNIKSGRIGTAQSKKNESKVQKQKIKQEYVPPREEGKNDVAGEGYYFEPLDE